MDGILPKRKQAWYTALRGLRVGLEAARAGCPYCEGERTDCHYCGPLKAAIDAVEGARFPRPNQAG